MDLAALIDALSRPSAYLFPVDAVRVVQTHISVVFLAGEYAYKVKKPVNPGFLDFSTLEKRHHFCNEEVRLNRRLAPDVYLGVVPVTAAGEGLRFEGEGEPVEWAVKMLRLPTGVTLHERLQAGEVGAALVEALARKIADFHRQTPAPADRRHYSRFDAVARNLSDVLDQGESQAGTTVSRAVLDRLRVLVEDALRRLHPLIESRAERGLTRDAHGDLHLDHVCVFPDRPPPGDLVVIDCIEFNERFRFIDPVADAAFPAMDLAFHGRRDLARVFADAYFGASGDDEGRALLPLYSAYRAAVRGSVEGIKLGEAEVSEAEHAATLGSSRGHWLLGLGELEDPARRPALLLVGGLPGTGKSTVAAAVAARAGFHRVRSDEVRKALAGLPEAEYATARLTAGHYTPAWSDRTYAESLRRAEQRLFEGGRVLIDATFREERHRRLFFDAAVRWGVPAPWLVCEAGPETVRQRLAARRGDVSDADWSVYREASSGWEEPGPAARRALRVISTEGTPEEAVAAALDALREAALM
jgi:aminoglycoside phosphotransferase family enzyme/predicted kinase